LAGFLTGLTKNKEYLIRGGALTRATWASGPMTLQIHGENRRHIAIDGDKVLVDDTL